MQPTFQYNAVITDIHDGDTITVTIDLGFRVDYRTPLRFNGINAPELKTPEGKASLAHLETLIAVGETVVIKTYKNPTDKYGRWIADIFVGDNNINQQMVKDGFAVVY